jgi:hypothetical protein
LAPVCVAYGAWCFAALPVDLRAHPFDFGAESAFSLTAPRLSFRHRA